MKKLLTPILFATFMLVPSITMAAEQTVKLSIPSMTCASCPYIVKAAVTKVEGVKSVEATLEELSAIVVFDDTLTSLEEIQQATADVGYPSTLIEGSEVS